MGNFVGNTRVYRGEMDLFSSILKNSYSDKVILDDVNDELEHYGTELQNRTCFLLTLFFYVSYK